MNAVDAAVADFSDAGFTVLRGAVPVALISRLRTQLRPMLEAAQAGQGIDLPVWQVVQPWCQAPLVLDVLALIGPVAARCLGTHQVQLLQDAMVAKPAHRGGAIAWHHDHAYTSWLTPPGSLSIRVALTAETAESGALVALHGSHRWEVAVQDLIGADSLGDDPRVRTGRSAAELLAAERVVELAPGDVSLHHSRTLHGSGANHAAWQRETLVAHVVASVVRIADADGPMAPYVALTPEGQLDPSAFPVLEPQRDLA